ncbi:MAG: class I SAM-dependent methyltransferase [Caldilinea sp.]|nr:class I SAM-dependent methyltransferase [Caldilineaceae bacterium]MCB9115005.1 class I SAM-dependent methyltransferase [Caldilineaceae bacterium]MCB9122560.1 class I SAM-dependent methyltransferase [Caldilineaceae bacterium]MCW5843653.1 class I SAM-dependent methyltransferase [Caldilinea sp.]
MSEAGNLLPSLYEAERVGGWNVGMRAASHAVLARQPLPPGPILEIGCGGGAFAAELAEGHPQAVVVGLDLRPEALAFAGAQGSRATWVQGNLLRLPFSDESFALVVALDVVDQKGIDAGQALAGIRRVVRPGGALLLRVSAHAWLYGPHDAAFNTGRRYGLAEFCAIVRGAGLEPVRATFANSLLAAPIVAMRLLQRWGLLPLSEDLYADGTVNRLLGSALQVEAGWLRRRDLPVGTSLFVVAVRPTI